FEKSILLLVIARTLRARQHGIVVRDDCCAGPLLTEQLCVDRADTGDNSVAGRVLDEVLERTPPALRGEGERAVLDEASFVEEIREVLPRGALVGLASPRDGVGPILVEPETMAGNRFPEIGPDFVRIVSLALQSFAFRDFLGRYEEHRVAL